MQIKFCQPMHEKFSAELEGQSFNRYPRKVVITCICHVPHGTAIEMKVTHWFGIIYETSELICVLKATNFGNCYFGTCLTTLHL